MLFYITSIIFDILFYITALIIDILLYITPYIFHILSHITLPIFGIFYISPHISLFYTTVSVSFADVRIMAWNSLSAELLVNLSSFNIKNHTFII